MNDYKLQLCISIEQEKYSQYDKKEKMHIK